MRGEEANLSGVEILWDYDAVECVYEEKIELHKRD
jgi:hypothetical protein